MTEPTPALTPANIPLAKGLNRQWHRCKRHGSIAYRDYTPYSLSNPICVMPCGCDVRDSEYISEKEAARQIKARNKADAHV